MAKTIEITFGEILKELRAEVGLSQEDLAYESDLDRSFISMMERGLRKPTISTLFRIAKPLKKSPTEIIRILETRYEDL